MTRITLGGGRGGVTKSDNIKKFWGSNIIFLKSRRRREIFELKSLPKWIFLQENRVLGGCLRAAGARFFLAVFSLSRISDPLGGRGVSRKVIILSLVTPKI